MGIQIKQLMGKCSLILLVVFLISCNQKEGVYGVKRIESGKTWYDTEGKPIESHAGGILIIDKVYYWYGENHALGQGNKTGVSCYSSDDLLVWKNRGVVFPKDSLPQQFRDSGVCERPKVLYNSKTRKYVMWMHLDGRNYTIASAGIAISDSPAGPFRFLGYKRPVHFDYGYKNARGPEYNPREAELGNTFRDMNLFLDEDGKAYVFYAAEDNATMYCVMLNEDFTDIAEPCVQGKTWQRILPFSNREAPAPFKYNGRYYLFTSGLTGWAPNPASLAVSDSILGVWKQVGNPCAGPGSETTFLSQSTYVLPAPGKNDGSFIFMADRWNGAELEKSSFTWIPFIIKDNELPRLFFIDSWDFSIFNTQPDKPQTPVLAIKKDRMLEWHKTKGVDFYIVCKSGKEIGTTSDTSFPLPLELAGNEYIYNLIARNIWSDSSTVSNSVEYFWQNADTIYLSDVHPESSKQDYGILEADRAINQSLINIAGITFHKGLGTHANSEVVYSTNAKYRKFLAIVGVDNYPIFSDLSSVQFEVFGDGTKLFQSGIMRIKDAGIPVDIDIRGVKVLKLLVNDAGDGNRWDHSDWANARLSP